MKAPLLQPDSMILLMGTPAKGNPLFSKTTTFSVEKHQNLILSLLYIIMLEARVSFWS